MQEWREISERTISRASEGPGLVEVGRMRGWPDLAVHTVHVVGTPAVRATLMEIHEQRAEKYADCQYYRYVECTDYAVRAQQRRGELESESGYRQLGDAS